MAFSKNVVRVSFIGTLVGSTILLKDYTSVQKYDGDAKLNGKVAIVTGANSGIGKETALGLAEREAEVILACRNLEKCHEARDFIVDKSKNEKVKCRKLDLASMSSIHVFAQEFKKEHKRLDILVNNAGIMMGPKQLTQDGFERNLGINYLGPLLLTHLLLDTMKESAPSRIINLTSVSYRKGSINFTDLNSSHNYHPLTAFNQSKLATVMWSQELAKQLQGSGVTVNMAYPGVTNTNIGRDTEMEQFFISKYVLSPLVWLIRQPTWRGAQDSIFLAVDPSVEKVTGKFFHNLKELEIEECARERREIKRLWVISEKWTRIS